MSSMGLRERKKSNTRERLRAVALDLFALHGFDSVTIDDIAAGAEISKTTFYRYFDSKEDVFIGTVTERLDRLRQALGARPNGESAVAAIRNAILALVAEQDDGGAAGLRRGRMIRTTPALTARFQEHETACESVLAAFLADRLHEPRTGLRARVVAAAVMGAVRATTEYWFDNGGDLPTLLAEALSRVDVA